MQAVQDTAQAERPYTETEQRNLQAVTNVLQYWNTHDIPGILNFYDDDIVWRNVAMEETYTGKREVGEFLSRLMTALPDLVFNVTYKIASRDNVSEQWTVSGTHLGTFWGIPPTGRQVEIRAMSMVELRDGKFLRDEFYFDTGMIMRQMGLMPSLAASQGQVGRWLLWAAVNRKRVGMFAGAAAAIMAVRRRRRGNADS